MPSGSNARFTSWNAPSSAGAELHAHLAQLLDAHAVLAGDRAADLDADLEDAAAELLRALELAGLARVVEDARMDVAVARVEDVRDHHAVLLRERVGAIEHVGKAAARDRSIHRVVVGKHRRQRGKRALARFPQPFALDVVGGDANLGCAATLQDAAHGRQLLQGLVVAAIDLGQQERLARPAGNPMARNFSQAWITMRSIISSAAGMMPAPMISPTASAASRTLGNTASTVSTRSGSGSSFTVTCVMTPRLPSLPVSNASTSKPAASSERPARLDRIAVAIDRAHREDVVGREAVLEAMHAARILGDVAPDGADRLARRIGRVEEAVRRGELRHLEVAHARLDLRRARQRRSIAITRFIFDTTSSTPSGCGMAPPEMPVPAPRETTGTPSSRHTVTMARTCSSDSGRTASIGVARCWMNASVSKGRKPFLVGDHQRLWSDRAQPLEGCALRRLASATTPIRIAAIPDAAMHRPSRASLRTRRNDAAWARPCRD